MESRRKQITDYFRQLDRSFYMDTDKELAAFDQAVSIGYGQTISQPSLVLQMTLALDPQPDSRVLEIGTGSGFQTAMLAPFSKTVYTVERIEALCERAQHRLKEAGFSNIHFKLGDGSLGWEEHAPYDRIMVTAAASEVPPELLNQLKPGGKMIIPVGSQVSQELLLIEKSAEGEITSSSLTQVLFVRLRGKYD